MTTTGQLIWSLVASVVAVVAASALALALIPPLTLPATIRGGTIALFSVIGVRVAMWLRLRRKAQ
ncbi:MAG TPA: hypothetical protein VM819_01465 [Vicinamibacterales bacterium]|nr:hypothetical protein [Vicinamibacterales bacterium]